MKTYVFPAVVEQHPSTGRYVAVFPDLPEVITNGENLQDASCNAWINLGFRLYHMEEEHIAIPEASDPSSIVKPEDAKIITVEVDMLAVRQALDNKSVKKIVTLPKWLIALGKENNINFSRVLRRALKEELGIYDEETGFLPLLTDIFR